MTTRDEMQTRLDAIRAGREAERIDGLRRRLVAIKAEKAAEAADRATSTYYRNLDVYVTADLRMYDRHGVELV